MMNLDFYGGYLLCHFHWQFLFMMKHENLLYVEIQVVGSNKKRIISVRVCVCINFFLSF
jgi:hypothetical protein